MEFKNQPRERIRGRIGSCFSQERGVKAKESDIKYASDFHVLK